MQVQRPDRLPNDKPQMAGPLALPIFTWSGYPARWAGLGKRPGLRPSMRDVCSTTCPGPIPTTYPHNESQKRIATAEKLRTSVRRRRGGIVQVQRPDRLPNDKPQMAGPLALPIFTWSGYPARWAGLGKRPGLRPSTRDVCSTTCPGPIPQRIPTTNPNNVSPQRIPTTYLNNVSQQQIPITNPHNEKATTWRRPEVGRPDPTCTTRAEDRCRLPSPGPSGQRKSSATGARISIRSCAGCSSA